MANEPNGKGIAFLVANAGVEQVGHTSPWRVIEDAGAKAILIAPGSEEIQAVNGDTDKDDTFDPDLKGGRGVRRRHSTRCSFPAASPTRTSCG